MCFPWQILAMIEEAAGTRMYEAKKQQAERTIEKKDAKLLEMNTVSGEANRCIVFVQLNYYVIVFSVTRFSYFVCFLVSGIDNCGVRWCQEQGTN
ncbi:Structural maintenance of chromosomes protein 2 [Portunus trituberculatus]|uniref:Structural maintenance of chromosomes protein 2 n=1 Tax=Portunus trituberculatus TaxID=210409 RepID=A0A5B7J6Q3_PORTR|nr:Structural maintenance of chromosomes protein 2 [Portunus trituberculatus]